MPLPTIIDSVLTEWSTVSVVETAHHRLLLQGETIIGCELRAPELRSQIAFAAMALMAFAVASTLPAPRSVLCLGLGAGTVPHYLRTQRIVTDVVEYDHAVIRMASRHFLFGADDGAGGQVEHANAIELIEKGTPRSHAYDAILSDLWNGGHNGRAMRANYFVALRQSWLRSGGVLAVNLVAYVDGPHLSLAVRVVRTIRHVFEHVRCFLEFDPAEATPDELQLEPSNVLCLASTDPVRLTPPAPTEERGDPPVGSMDWLHAHYHRWEAPRLEAAASGLEGEPLLSEDDWHSLAPERAAVAKGMREQQQRNGLLTHEEWRALGTHLNSAVSANSPSSSIKAEL